MDASLKKKAKVEFFVIVLITLVAVVLFWDKSLDLKAARLFYHPSHLKDPWFEQDFPIWNFFYHSAPWLTGILLFGSLGVLLGAMVKDEWKKYRRYSVYIFLAVGLGPGLFVNSIFKPYWGRPRPREVIELGGKYEYQPFYKAKLGGPGKSFPCGHCSVGFVYMAFWLLLRKRRPNLATGFFVGSLVFGSLLGVGRMAAGGHFLSDVVGAALIVWTVNWWLYYFGLKIPQAETGELSEVRGGGKISQLMSRPWIEVSVYSVLGFATVLVLLLASPFHSEIQLRSDGDRIKLNFLNIKIARGDVELVLDNQFERAFEIEGSAKGFGFPGNKVLQNCTEKVLVPEAGDKLIPIETTQGMNCEITTKGFFSDYESLLRLKINPTKVEKLDLEIERGDFNAAKTGVMPAAYQVRAKSSR